jgi:hypothetical protein
MPRIWFSSPRILGGLVRPGISFALSELSKKPSRTKRGREPAPELELAAPAPPSTATEHIPLHARIIAWIIYGFAIYGFLALVGCVGGGAHAGTCPHVPGRRLCGYELRGRLVYGSRSRRNGAAVRCAQRRL